MSKVCKKIGFTILLMIFIGGFEGSRVSIAQETYSLGVAMGLTGTGAPYSKEAVEGIELAVHEINAKGGLLGKYPIKLSIKDTQTKPHVAAIVAKELIDRDKVRCIIGTYSSATALIIKPMCRESGVLQIATVSNAEDITRVDFSPYTFSVVPNTYMEAKATVLGIAKLAKEKGWKTYVTIASDYAWGRSSQENQVELMKKIAPGIKLLGAYWPRLGQSRFNSFIVDITAKKPDFVLSTIAGEDNVFWMRDARDYGLLKDVEYPGGLVSVSELISQAKSIRRGIYGRCRAPFFAHMNIPMMTIFVENYRKKYNRYPTDWAVMSYDGVYALKQGVEAAKSIDTEKVKKAMTGLSIDTCRGKLSFRNIDNQLNCSAYFGRIADDPKYPFPIYHDLMEYKGPDIWRAEAEITKARAK